MSSFINCKSFLEHLCCDRGFFLLYNGEVLNCVQFICKHISICTRLLILSLSPNLRGGNYRNDIVFILDPVMFFNLFPFQNTYSPLPNNKFIIPYPMKNRGALFSKGKKKYLKSCPLFAV